MRIQTVMWWEQYHAYSNDCRRTASARTNRATACCSAAATGVRRGCHSYKNRKSLHWTRQIRTKPVLPKLELLLFVPSQLPPAPWHYGSYCMLLQVLRAPRFIKTSLAPCIEAMATTRNPGAATPTERLGASNCQRSFDTNAGTVGPSHEPSTQ